MRRVLILFAAALSLASLGVAGDVKPGKANGPACCLRKAASATYTPTVTAGDPGRDARFRMKYGRSLPGLEQDRALAVASADHAACEPECCKHARKQG